MVGPYKATRSERYPIRTSQPKRPDPRDPVRATRSVRPSRAAAIRVRSDLRSANGESRAEQAGAGGERMGSTRAVARTECTSPPCRGRADHAASALDLALHAHL